MKYAAKSSASGAIPSLNEESKEMPSASKQSDLGESMRKPKEIEEPWIKPELDFTVSSDLNYKSSSYNRLKYF
jgi:hypothetical protein